MKPFDPTPARLPNWIAGAPVEPDRAAWHRAARAPDLPAVPRTPLVDARAALEAARAAAVRWRALARAARAALLEPWWDALCVPADAAPGTSPLGLEADEARQLERLELERLRAPHGEDTGGAAEIVWIPQHWDELGAPGLRRVRRALLGGAAAILAPDPLWPQHAQRAVEAWAARGLPAGLLQLLHGIEELERDARWPEQLGLAVARPARQALDVDVHDGSALGPALASALARVDSLSGRYFRRTACLSVGAARYSDAIEEVRACIERGDAAGARLAPPLPGPGNESSDRLVRVEAALRRLGAVRVPTRPESPALFVNYAGSGAQLAGLPGGPWLCLRRIP